MTSSSVTVKGLQARSSLARKSANNVSTSAILLLSIPTRCRRPRHGLLVQQPSSRRGPEIRVGSRPEMRPR